MKNLIMLGYTIHPNPVPGTVAVTGPFRPGSEDWMLHRVINELRSGGIPIVLVQERARLDQGGYMGVSVWRASPRPKNVEKRGK